MSNATPSLWDRRRLIRDSSLTAQQKCLLFIIDDYAGDDGNCFAAVPTLASNLSLSARQTQHLIQSLEVAGIIEREERPGRSSIIKICWSGVKPVSGVKSTSGVKPASPEGCSPLHPSGEACFGGGVKPTSYKLPINTPITPQLTQNDKCDSKRFQKPSVEEIGAYCRDRGNSVDPQRFFDHYESKGWKIGKSPMKDWRASVRTWESNQKQEGLKHSACNIDLRSRRHNSGQVYDPTLNRDEFSV